MFPRLEQAEHWLDLLRRHAAIVERERGRVRVSAVEGAEVVRRHYAESLEIVRVAVEADGTPGTLVDVGSGGGFPGLVAACVLPETRVVLVEPLKKRAALLVEAARELGLENVEVVAERAEDAGRGVLRGSADVVTARAVAETRVLIEYTSPFARDGGLVALAKGSATDEELTAAGQALRELRCEVEEVVRMRPEISQLGQVMLLRRRGAVDERYPRRAGAPAKRPL